MNSEPRRTLHRLLISAVIVGHAISCDAAQLQIDKTAIEKLIKTQWFDAQGKWHLAKADRCNDPYLENPSIAIHQGRLTLKARFAGRVGTEVMGTCISVGEPSWIDVSGTPSITGHTVSLGDIRVESVEKPAVRAIASTLLEASLRSSASVDLDSSIRPLLVFNCNSLCI
jgi:hypothetical protein